jgi:DNA-binding phage protein
MSRILCAMDIEQVRAALHSRRGEWSKIATTAGINRKTVGRIMADPEYLPTLRTLRAVARALAGAAGQSQDIDSTVREAA